MAQEFAYASMAIRVMEKGFITSQQWQRLLQSPNIGEAAAVLRETRYSEFFDKLDQPEDFEIALGEAFKSRANEISELIEDEPLKNFLYLKYDLHNLKLLIKQETPLDGLKTKGKHEVDYEPLKFPFGSLPVSQVKEWLHAPSSNPEETLLQKAVAEGRETWVKTQDAQELDFVLDRWSFKMMKELAENSEVEFFKAYAQKLTDVTNFLSFYRARRQEKTKDFFALVLLEGGAIHPEEFIERYPMPEPEIGSLLHKAQLGQEFEKAVADYQANQDITALERAKDNVALSMAKKGARTPTGPEVLFCYFVILETEIQNLRILLSGKRVGIAPEAIKERMRIHE